MSEFEIRPELLEFEMLRSHILAKSVDYHKADERDASGLSYAEVDHDAIEAVFEYLSLCDISVGAMVENARRSPDELDLTFEYYDLIRWLHYSRPRQEVEHVVRQMGAE